MSPHQEIEHAEVDGGTIVIGAVWFPRAPFFPPSPGFFEHTRSKRRFWEPTQLSNQPCASVLHQIENRKHGSRNLIKQPHRFVEVGRLHVVSPRIDYELAAP